MASELGGSRAVRISDLHLPDILPVLRLPVITTPPPRITDNDTVSESMKDPETDTIDNVIKILKSTDVSKLRPLGDSKLQPDDLTPLITTFQSRSPGLFNLQKDEINLRHKTLHEQKHHHFQSTPLQHHTTPISYISPHPKLRQQLTPGTSPPSQQHSAKRPKTTLKINITGTEKTIIAPTAKEKAQSMAETLSITLLDFCAQHKQFLAQKSTKNEDDDADMDIGNDQHHEQQPNQAVGDENKEGSDISDIVDIETNDTHDAIPLQLKKSTSSTTATTATGIKKAAIVKFSPATFESPMFLLSSMQSLTDLLHSYCINPSILPHVPRDLLVNTLSTLRSIIDKSKHTLVCEGDTEGSVHIVGLLASLEAAVGVLRISLTPYGDIHVVSEESIDSVVESVRYQIQHNILPFFDARLRSATRPELGKKKDGKIEVIMEGIKDEIEEKHYVMTKGGQRRQRRSSGGIDNMNEKNAPQPNQHAGIRDGGGIEIPPALWLSMDRVQTLLALLSDTLPLIKIPAAILAPLLRTLATTLATSTNAARALSSLRSKASLVLSAAYCNLFDLRKSVLDDVFAHAMPYLPTGRNIPREYSVDDGDGCNTTALVSDTLLPRSGAAAAAAQQQQQYAAIPQAATSAATSMTMPMKIQIFTATILHMVQGSAKLPDADSDVAAVIQAYAPSVKTADYFWTICLDKLHSARSMKADNDVDIAPIISNIIQDLLSAVFIPQWPAAGTLLLRLAAALNSEKGLQHQDASVRQFCIDILGKIVAAIHNGEHRVKENVQWLYEMAKEHDYQDLHAASQEMILKYLADGQRVASPAAASARRFVLVKSLSENAAAMNSEAEEEEETPAKGGTTRHESDDLTSHGKKEKRKKRTSRQHKTSSSSEDDHDDDDDTPVNQQRKTKTCVQDRVGAMLTSAWQRCKELEALSYDTGIDPGVATLLMQCLVTSDFQRASLAILSWILEMMDPANQAPTTRAKAVRALADLAAADPSVLEIAAVQAAIERSLQEESVSVREASLSLLGKRMVGDPGLATKLLDTVMRAVEDVGPSVRKCAIKILKDTAIAVPGFARSAEACCTLLARGSDPEESVQSMVAKVFHSLWFSPQVEMTVLPHVAALAAAAAAVDVTTPHAAASTVLVKRSAAERAQQLADVAMTCYEAGGPTIRLPLDANHSLVVVLRSALELSIKSDRTGREFPAASPAGREITETLLEFVLNTPHHRHGNKGDDLRDPGGHENNNRETIPTHRTATTRDKHPNDRDDHDDRNAALPPLIALHALSVTAPSLCIPDADPLKFLRSLAPHFKTSTEEEGSSCTEEDQRHSAERLLCMLSIVDCVLVHVDHVTDVLGALRDLPADLVNLINQHRYTQVVAAACKCLSALARRSPAAAARLNAVAAVYFSWLVDPRSQNPANLPRFLFIMGQLCRYGAATLEQQQQQSTSLSGTPANHGAPKVSLSSCLKLFTKYWTYTVGTSARDKGIHGNNSAMAMQYQIRRCALESAGQLSIARPSAMVDAGSESQHMLSVALRPDALPGYKLVALGSLTELLQEDADSLHRRQKSQSQWMGGEKSQSQWMGGEMAKTPGVMGHGSSSLSSKKRKQRLSSNKKAKNTTVSSSSSTKKKDAGKRKRKKGRKGTKEGSDDKDGEGDTSMASTDEEEEDDEDQEEGHTATAPVATTVAIENGEGDTLSQSSAVLQQHWDAVLVLAIDGNGARDNHGTTANGAAAVRRRVLSLMEVVLRDGLVGPWTAVPTLVALCSDTYVDVRTRALRLLCQLSEKHGQYVDAGRLTAGIEEAAKLHGHGRRRLVPAAAFAGLGAVYQTIVWPNRARRSEFLRLMLRYFRSAISHRRSLRDAPPATSLLSFVASAAAALPMRRGEEICLLIQEAGSIIAGHVDAVLVELQACIEKDEQQEEDGRGTSMHGGGGDPNGLRVSCYHASVLCMLHRLKRYLERAYGISAERSAAFVSAGGAKRKTGEDAAVVVLDENRAGALLFGDLEVYGDGDAVIDVMKVKEMFEELESARVGVEHDDDDDYLVE